ncbi:MAG: DUF2905 domain-containing protein [Balneolia bacterium]|nr:DUF2905 domain-containing protein [Balneolia bacterium]
MSPDTGRIIVIIGILIVLAGLIIMFFGNKLSWIGNLPGDIRIERGNTRIYFPVVTMILVSIILTIVIRLFQRFF